MKNLKIKNLDEKDIQNIKQIKIIELEKMKLQDLKILKVKIETAIENIEKLCYNTINKITCEGITLSSQRGVSQWMRILMCLGLSYFFYPFFQIFNYSIWIF